MPTPRLQADGLLLEPPMVADATDWSEAQDDECARWFGWPCRPGVERCRAHLEQVVAEEDPDTYVWAIRRDGELVGGIDLKAVEAGWNVSYFVHPAHRGHGVATRAVCRVVAWAFEGLALSAVATTVHVDNMASRTVLERAGFEHVGDEPGADGDHLEAVYRCDAASTRPD